MVLPVGAVHDEDEAVHLVVILRPDPAEALAAAQVIDGDVVTLQYHGRIYLKRLYYCSIHLKTYLARRKRNLELNGKEITVCIAEIGFDRN